MRKGRGRGEGGEMGKGGEGEIGMDRVKKGKGEERGREEEG
ncbi:hypothetical protein [Escherichia coli]|nr:hypothetical protein [Escherichia coli]